MTQSSPKAPSVVRHEAPLLDATQDRVLEGNICTPSVITLPNWAWEGAPDLYGSSRLACYFAHHTGRGIRLAVADQPEGPWRVLSMGSPSLAETPFAMPDPVLPSETRFVDWMDLTSPDGWMRAGLRQDGSQWRMKAHIASPDVHIDDESECLWMTYHGLLASGDQGTRLALSRDGVLWDAGDAASHPLLGPPYFRGFEGPDGMRYALTVGGGLLRAERPEGPYELGQTLVPPNAAGCAVRHLEGHVRDEILHLFYSRIGDTPESLYHASLVMTGDWQKWQAEGETILLTPEHAWEGGDLDPVPSQIGAAIGRECALRDPCIFQAVKGPTYLFYIGGGESSLCLAELVWDE